MSSPPYIRQFAWLFNGRKDAYGLGRGAVVREPVTPHLYLSHLKGEDSGIGIFPVVDDHVHFCAVDLDEPDFDLAELIAELIPGRTFIERSRSGNAHIWAFFGDEPAPAWVVRGNLRNATEAVGRPDIEIFPKQDRLLPGMVGNYINLPYHGNTRPIIDNGTELLCSEFCQLAVSRMNDPKDWERQARTLGVKPPAEHDDADTEWGERPVLHDCAMHIIEGAISGERPIVEGHRHQVFFHLAKQLLNYEGLDGEECYEILTEVNRESPEPLPDSELRRTFHNAVRGKFRSTGCDDPIMAPYVSPTCPIAARAA